MGGRYARFRRGDDAPAIMVTMRDVRCSMVNLDPTPLILRRKC